MTKTAGIARFDAAPPAPQTLSPHLNGGVIRRAALVALILGSVLMLTNQSGAIFGQEKIQLLPFLLVYLTPFVVVTISRVLGARQAAADAGAGKACGPAVETIASTAFSHGIPARAATASSRVPTRLRSKTSKHWSTRSFRLRRRTPRSFTRLRSNDGCRR